MKVVKHAVVICAALFLCLGLPLIHYRSTGAFSSSVDTVSSASLVVPDQPSGTFYILLNERIHPDTVSDWTAFFEEKEVGVIMEDVSCLVTEGDVRGRELAERYRARLAENQMRMTEENGTLIASKADAGIFDVILLSEGAAGSYGYDFGSLRRTVKVITVTGGDL